MDGCLLSAKWGRTYGFRWDWVDKMNGIIIQGATQSHFSFSFHIIIAHIMWRIRCFVDAFRYTNNFYFGTFYSAEFRSRQFRYLYGWESQFETNRNVLFIWRTEKKASYSSLVLMRTIICDDIIHRCSVQILRESNQSSTNSRAIKVDMRIFSHKKTFKRPNFLSKVIKTIFPLKLAEKGFIINRAMVEVCRVKFKTFSH